MGKKQWKRGFMAVFIIVIAAFFTACGKEGKKTNSNNLRSEYVYQSTYQPIDTSMEFVSNACIKDERIYLYGTKWVEDKKDKENGGKTFSYIANMGIDGSDLQETELKGLAKGEYIETFVLDDQNQLRLLTREFHYNNKTGVEKIIYRIYTLNEKGKIGDSIELKTTKKDLGDTYFYIDSRSIVFSDHKIYVAVENKVYIFNENGKVDKVYEQEQENGYISCMFLSGEGKVYTYGWVPKGDNGNYAIMELDPETGKFGAPMDFGDYMLYNLTVHAADGNKLFMSDGNNIYTYNLSNKKLEVELNWLNSDIDGESVCEYFPLKDEKILAINTSYDDSKKKNTLELVTLNKMKASEVKEKKLLIFASAYLDFAIKSKILSFNKTEEDYRIEVMDYSAYEEPTKKLNLDITAGKIPDILDISGISRDQLIKKGLFLDLYDFIEKDEEIKKEDFFPSVLNALEVDGKLHFLPSNFGLRGLVGSKKNVGDIEGWTMAEMIEKYNHMPKGRVFMSYITRDEFVNIMIRNNMNEYVHWNTGEVNFDTEDFINIIEFSKDFSNEIDYDSQAEDRPFLMKKGLLFLEEFYFDELIEVEAYTDRYKDKGGYKVLGYPSSDKSDKLGMNIYGEMLAITKQCKEKEGAWKFIRQFMTYEHQKDIYGFPTRLDVFEEKIERVQATKDYIDENGNKVPPLTEDYGYERPVSDQEVEMVKSWIERIGFCTSYDTTNQDIYEIMNEEIQAFYAGDKTAKEVAEIIQSRVKIYVSENS